MNSNGFKKIVVTVLSALLVSAFLGLFYQMRGYASDEELAAAEKACKERAAAAKVERDAASKEREATRADVADINVAIGSIDTALEILLDNYKKAKKGTGG